MIAFSNTSVFSCDTYNVCFLSLLVFLFITKSIWSPDLYSPMYMLLISNLWHAFWINSPFTYTSQLLSYKLLCVLLPSTNTYTGPSFFTSNFHSSLPLLSVCIYSESTFSYTSTSSPSIADNRFCWFSNGSLPNETFFISSFTG